MVRDLTPSNAVQRTARIMPIDPFAYLKALKELIVVIASVRSQQGWKQKTSYLTLCLSTNHPTDHLRAPLSPICRLGVDAVEKVFWGNEGTFLKLLMRFVRSDVRDHIESQKNNHGPSYW